MPRSPGCRYYVQGVRVPYPVWRMFPFLRRWQVWPRLYYGDLADSLQQMRDGDVSPALTRDEEIQ